ncbi:MAG: outer membrane beta-barrel protein [Sedimentisphaerales bacterium]|nr:outer membrane beta-barrel protein [Sedimentisphaerales bacterium]
MNAKGITALALLAALAMAVGGCSHGRGVEMGVFGAGLDSRDLGEGFGGGVKLELNPLDRISVDARVSYINFDDTDVEVMPVEAAGLFNFPMLGERIVPYAGAGVGYYHFDGNGADIDDEFGFFPLAGLEIGLQRLSILAEARWLFLQTDVDAAKAELANITKANIDSLGINIGVLYRF